MTLDVDDDIKDVLDYLNKVPGYRETISQNLHVRESKITELRNSPKLHLSVWGKPSLTGLN